MNTLLENLSPETAQVTKPIRFFCAAPEADLVHLMGDFNQWNPRSHPMQRARQGWWSLTIPLAYGDHQYLFVVDGRPTLDPHASRSGRNPRYEQVSLIEVD